MDIDAKVAEIDRKLTEMSRRTDLEPLERDTCIDRLLDRRLACG